MNTPTRYAVSFLVTAIIFLMISMTIYAMTLLGQSAPFNAKDAASKKENNSILCSKLLENDSLWRMVDKMGDGPAKEQAIRKIAMKNGCK